MILLGEVFYVGCLPKKDFDDFVAEHGKKCDGERERDLICVCDTDLCNNPNEDDESGVETIVPQIAMVFLLCLSVH